MNLFKKIFNLKTSETIKEDKSFEEIYTDLGMFEYNEQGFKFTSKDSENFIKWTDIEEINAYKKDVYAYDLIMMEICLGENTLIINEETPGWFQLVIKLKEMFPNIPKDWEMKITQPPFAKNYTNILKKA
ncbi:hypothetical protein [uncultured Flavobacterium sp.]|uniref:hypothetical protein n=1 Tax=uncultured Flavobacterium sp. TaxID=165435 RepID=UPI0030EC4448|tara:strand:+ start:113693 stop:114082 length:390 start_codon:yes stop_codon:yes gene_type:complete